VNKIIKFKINEIEPEKDIVFKENGYSSNKKNIPEKIQNLYEESLNIFLENSNPVGIYSEISKDEFAKIFFGEGNNSDEAPIRQIYPKADNIALFAVTLGKKVSEKIRELFRKNDFALGHILDCIASLAADNAVRNLEEFTIRLHSVSVFAALRSSPATAGYAQTRHSDKSTGQAEKNEEHQEDLLTLAYSPGYCGWHISGQKKLFEYLHPEKIQITLNNSFLMNPLKSVSGVLITGKREIHKFKNSFSFCYLCKTKSCLERM
jgi:hypothetical protein